MIKIILKKVVMPARISRGNIVANDGEKSEVCSTMLEKSRRSPLVCSPELQCLYFQIRIPFSADKICFSSSH